MFRSAPILRNGGRTPLGRVVGDYYSRLTDPLLPPQQGAPAPGERLGDRMGLDPGWVALPVESEEAE